MSYAQPPQIAWVLSIIIFLLGLSPVLASTYLDSRGIYRIRIEVFNPAKEAVHDADVTSSAGGELKKTDAGWEFTIPREEKPANGEVTFRAALKYSFLQGNSTLVLTKDYFPQVIIQLAPLSSVDIRGMVEDENGRPIEGARVWVLGYDDIATTGPTGSFSLPAHAADDQQITLLAQKGDLTAQKMALTPLAGRSEKPVLVKYDPRDLSRVYFRDDNGEYWEIPYRDLRLPPISLWEHHTATKQLRAEGRRSVDERVLFEVVEQQRYLAEGARKSTRARRAAERRRTSSDSLGDSFASEQSPPPPGALHKEPVQPFEVEEWD